MYHDANFNNFLMEWEFKGYLRYKSIFYHEVALDM